MVPRLDQIARHQFLDPSFAICRGDPRAADKADDPRILDAELVGGHRHPAVLDPQATGRLQHAIRLVRHRGRVSLFAGFSKGVQAEIDVNAIHYNELVVTGSFGLTRLHFERALQLIASGHLKLDSLLTHRFGLAEIEKALAVAEQGSAIKVAIV